MQYDLNDLYYFAEVVTHGGFAPAGRALREPKSKLSRRIADLEERLGVRLIERSTRRFRVTEVGQAFYERCRSLLIEAEDAHAVIAESKGEPRGAVRFSCPGGMLEIIAPILPPFLERHPGVRLQILASNKAVDLIDQKIDVALRIRSTLDSDASLTMRTLTSSVRILVAAPTLAASLPADLDIGLLTKVPVLSSVDQGSDAGWTLANKAGEVRTLRLEPRMSCGDFGVLRTASLAGLGVALLPEHACRQELADGRLVRVLSDWSGQPGLVHLVFTTRRGLPPAVRAFIDHLAPAPPPGRRRPGRP